MKFFTPRSFLCITAAAGAVSIGCQSTQKQQATSSVVESTPSAGQTGTFYRCVSVKDLRATVAVFLTVNQSDPATVDDGVIDAQIFDIRGVRTQRDPAATFHVNERSDAALASISLAVANGTGAASDPIGWDEKYLPQGKSFDMSISGITTPVEGKLTCKAIVPHPTQPAVIVPATADLANPAFGVRLTKTPEGPVTQIIDLGTWLEQTDGGFLPGGEVGYEAACDSFKSSVPAADLAAMHLPPDYDGIPFFGTTASAGKQSFVYRNRSLVPLFMTMFGAKIDPSLAALSAQGKNFVRVAPGEEIALVVEANAASGLRTFKCITQPQGFKFSYCFMHRITIETPH